MCIGNPFKCGVLGHQPLCYWCRQGGQRGGTLTRDEWGFTHKTCGPDRDGDAWVPMPFAARRSATDAEILAALKADAAEGAT